MTNVMKSLSPLALMAIATLLEVNGDALIRKAMYNYTGIPRFGFFAAGATLLFGYGFTLNLAPLEFGHIVGLYIATLFIVWQITNYTAFGTLPTLPILVGGAFIIMGG